MERFDFMIGASVFCQNERCGRLARIAVNPESWEAEQLIVESGSLARRAHVVPITAVAQTSAHEVWLAITAAELATLPEFRETELRIAPNWEDYLPQFSRAEVPATAVLMPGLTESTAATQVVEETVRDGLADELSLVKRGTAIRNREKELGKLDHVIVDAESGQVTDLVVRHGTFLPRRVRLPVAAITEVGEEAIVVATTKEDFDALPEY